MELITRPTELIALPAALAQLPSAGATASRIAAAHVFSAYQQRRPANTLRRQRADLATFAAYLAACDIHVADLADDPEAWIGTTWGLVAGFVQWQLNEGYAIGSINVRLSTVKTYAKLATQAGAIPPAEYALIRTAAGFRHGEARNLDAQRTQTRRGAKKAAPTPLTLAQARQLKDQPNPQDTLMLCILLDHGLRCGELASLHTTAFDLPRGTMTFYREKVDLQQTHQLTAGTLRAALRHLGQARPGPLLLGGDGEPLTVRDINRRVGELGKAIGIDKLSPHDCRHFWSTAAVRGGTDIKSLQDAGGWASPAMPLRYVESQAIANAGVRLG